MNQLTVDVMKSLAAWEEPLPGWVSFKDDDRPEANYSTLLESLSAIAGYLIWIGNGYEYSDTYFDIFVFRKDPETERGGTGIHVALSRFAPIGIYCKGRRTEKAGSGPNLKSLYSIPDLSFRDAEIAIVEALGEAQIYLPSEAELSRPIDFDIPDLFRSNANLGCSAYFDVLINDLY